MTENNQFDLVADRKGMVWDILLYVPTVIALASIATSFWFSENQNMGYLFYFLSCFFFIAGVNRIFKTRLMLLPSAPVSFVVEDQKIRMGLKNGSLINLIKNIRYYADYAGKSFGISGLDGSGKLMQFVFLKGQFSSEKEFDSARQTLKNQFKQ
jgi:hypothetical protein